MIERYLVRLYQIFIAITNTMCSTRHTNEVIINLHNCPHYNFGILSFYELFAGSS